MPEFDYQCSRTGRIITLHQSVHDKHEYVDEDGVKWDRIFTVPQAIISSLSNLDPKDSKAFVKATAEKSGSLGDLFQLSAEMSEKRTAKEGRDGIKEKSWENYEKSRPKTVHPDRKKQQLKETFAKNKVFDIDI